MPETREVEIRDFSARAGDTPREAAAFSPLENVGDMPSDKMVLNMGPSHPSTHGVLRIILELDGEIITKA